MADYFLVGDSHLGAFGQACAEAGVDVAGDVSMPGLSWHCGRWSYRNGNFVFPVPRSQLIYDQALERVGAARCAEVGVPFVVSIGFHTGGFVLDFPVGCRITQNSRRWQFITTATLEAWIMDARRQHFAVLEELCALGKTVFSIVPPQREADSVLAFRINEIIAHQVTQLGVTVIDLNPDTVGKDGRLRPEYHRDKRGDYAHANAAYGHRLLDSIRAAS